MLQDITARYAQPYLDMHNLTATCVNTITLLLVSGVKYHIKFFYGLMQNAGALSCTDLLNPVAPETFSASNRH